MNTMNLPFVAANIPATKSGQRDLAEQLVGTIENGDVNPLEAVVLMKSLSEVINTFLKDDRVKDAVLAECGRYGKGEHPAFRGATVQVKESGVKYDFMACGDPLWTACVAHEQEAAEARKEREKYLRGITKPKSELDEETGEVFTLNPPARQSTTTYAVLFKNE